MNQINITRLQDFKENGKIMYFMKLTVFQSLISQFESSTSTTTRDLTASTNTTTVASGTNSTSNVTATISSTTTINSSRVMTAPTSSMYIWEFKLKLLIKSFKQQLLTLVMLNKICCDRAAG